MVESPCSLNQESSAFRHRECQRQKGGEEEFDCQYVRLTTDDLLTLKEVIESGDIAKYDDGGFFFGHGGYDEHMKEQDIQFIVDAIDTIGWGNAIYYYAWY